MRLISKKPITEEQLRVINIILENRKCKLNMSFIAEQEEITLEEAISWYGKDGELYNKKISNFKPKEPVFSVFNENAESVPSVWCRVYILGDKNIEEPILEFDYIDGDETSDYEYALWVKWILEKVLLPIGIGIEDYEEIFDTQIATFLYKMVIKDNKVSVHDSIITFSEEDSFKELEEVNNENILK